MEKAKCEIWQKYKNNALVPLLTWDEKVVFRGWQMLRFLGSEFYLIIENVFRERRMQFLDD